MKRRELVWAAPALAEFAELVAYIRGQDPATADRVAARIDERIGSLLAHPRIGRLGRVRGTRELVVSPFVKRGSIDSTIYNTTSMLRTMELILGLQPMTMWVAPCRFRCATGFRSG